MSAKQGFRSPSEFVRDADAPPTPAPAPPAAAPAPAAPQGPKIPHPAPWADASPRVIVHFGLRVPEPLHLKLKWLADNTAGESMHSLALEALRRDVDRRLAAFGPRKASSDERQKG